MQEVDSYPYSASGKSGAGAKKRSLVVNMSGSPDIFTVVYLRKVDVVLPRATTGPVVSLCSPVTPKLDGPILAIPSIPVFLHERGIEGRRIRRRRALVGRMSNSNSSAPMLKVPTVNAILKFGAET